MSMFAASRRGIFGAPLAQSDAGGPPLMPPNLPAVPQTSSHMPISTGMFASQGRRFQDMVGGTPTAPKKDSPWKYVAMGVAGALSGDPRLGAQWSSNLRDRRDAEQSAYQKAMEQHRNASMIANLPGMTERELATYMSNPEAWAKANASRFEAATLSEKDTRVFGDPNNGGSAYQAPRFIENGVDTIQVDPMGGFDPRTVYQGMTDGEQYGRALGREPGSPDWNRALEDEQLGGDGPTAFDRDQQLEGLRHSNRVNLRSMPTYAQANPRPPSSAGGRGGGRPTSLSGVIAPLLAKVSQGQPLSAGEQQALDTYYRRNGNRGGGRAAGGARGAARPTATGPNGQKVEWNGSAWVPAR